MKVQVFHMIRIAGEFDFGHLAPVGRDLDTMEVVQ